MQLKIFMEIQRTHFIYWNYSDFVTRINNNLVLLFIHCLEHSGKGNFKKLVYILKFLLSVAVWVWVGKELPDIYFQKGVSLLKTRSRDNEGTANVAG